jgi:ketosteroid isomerase-like protein
MRFCGRPIRGSLVTVAALLTAVIGLCMPAFAIHGLHERKHDAKKQVEALEEQWRTAQLTGDIATMDKMLSDDYIGISMTGQVSTKIQQLDRVRERKYSINQIHLGEMQVKLVGAIAIVTSRAEVSGTSDGMPVNGTYRYTRVYQHLPNDGWRITSFEATRVPQSRQALDAKRGDAAKVANDHLVGTPE